MHQLFTFGQSKHNDGHEPAAPRSQLLALHFDLRRQLYSNARRNPDHWPWHDHWLATYLVSMSQSTSCSGTSFGYARKGSWAAVQLISILTKLGRHLLCVSGAGLWLLCSQVAVPKILLSGMPGPYKLLSLNSGSRPAWQALLVTRLVQVTVPSGCEMGA